MRALEEVAGRELVELEGDGAGKPCAVEGLERLAMRQVRRLEEPIGASLSTLVSLGLQHFEQRRQCAIVACARESTHGLFGARRQLEAREQLAHASAHLDAVKLLISHLREEPVVDREIRWRDIHGGNGRLLGRRHGPHRSEVGTHARVSRISGRSRPRPASCSRPGAGCARTRHRRARRVRRPERRTPAGTRATERAPRGIGSVRRPQVCGRATR